MKNYTKNKLPKIIWGNESTKQTINELQYYQTKRCFIISGSHIIHHELSKELLQDLNDHHIEYEIFDQVSPEPTDILCIEVAGKIKEYQPDCIIGLGGGSPMDAAKAASLIAGIDEEINDLHEYGKTGTKMKESWLRPCPLILIPTTSGSSAETTASAVITSTIHHLKFSFGNRHIQADCAIIDPLFTVGMPQNPTIYGGLDALSHATENLVGTASNEYTNIMMLKCIEKVLKWLPIAVKEPNNLEAREHLSWASHNSLANGGIPNGHAVAHALGSLYHLVHGHACALVLPTVIRHFALSASNQIKDLALLMDLDLKDDPQEIADDVADYLVDFYRSLGIKNLQDTFKEKHIEDNLEEFTSKMVPTILDDFKSKHWLPPIHNDQERINKVCEMIYNEK